jgi:hypothetical protein
MGYDATGKLTYGPNNLCLQSQTFDNATWTAQRATVTANATAAPDGTLTADKLIEDATASNTHRITQTPTTAASAYTWSVYAKADTRSWLYLRVDRIGPTTPIAWFNVSNGTVGTVQTGFTASIQSVGNGWYRCTATVDVALAGANNIMIGLATADNVSSYTGDGTSGIFIWGAQLEAVTYQTTPSTYYPTTTAAYYGPRLVYDPVTLASQGILVEEARTNSCTQSQDLSTTWTLGGSTVTANNTTSPDGTVNADKLVEDSSAAAEHRCFNTFTGVSGTTYTYSVYAKADTRGGINIRMQATGTPIDIYYDVSAGAVTSTTAGTGSIQSVGNGWYRCIATGASDLSGSVRITINLLQTAGGTTRIYNGDGTSGLFLWQAQVEAGTGASSPVPTTTAAVTRAADVARLTGLSLAYPLSLAAGFIKNFGAATSRALTLYIDGNNFATLGVTTALATRLEVAQGGSFQAQLTGATPGLGAATLEAGRFATNDVGFAAQGALVGTDVSATMPAAPTAANIGMFSDGGTEPLNGTISRIRIYNRALSDAQLQSLTT